METETVLKMEMLIGVMIMEMKMETGMLVIKTVLTMVI